MAKPAPTNDSYTGAFQTPLLVGVEEGFTEQGQAAEVTAVGLEPDEEGAPFIDRGIRGGVASAGLAGLLTHGQIFFGSSASVAVQGNAGSVITDQSTLEADWQARTAHPGVIAYHDFRSDAEVNRFRRQGGIGNDVSGTGDGSCRRITTDGITGGGCMEIAIPAGGTAEAGWVRPFSALSGETNGRGVDDPGETVLDWNVVDQTDYVASWKHDYIAHPDNQSATGYDFLGGEIYIQFRVKIAAGRFDSGQPDGKLAFVTVCGPNSGGHYTPSQELVLVSRRNAILRMYTNFASGWNGALTDPQEGGGDGAGTVKQPGGAYDATCIDNINCLKCWCYPADEWVTVLIHLRPGLDNVSTDLADPANDVARNTELEIKVARANETEYTTVYSKADYVIDFSTQTDAKGWNAFLPSGYMNGNPANVDQGWTHRYDQIIFSRQPILPPGAPVTDLREAASGLAKGGFTQFTKNTTQVGDDIKWMTKGIHYDAERKEIQYCGKPASGSSTTWGHYIYDEATDAWRREATAYNSLGHNWLNTLDPATGDHYLGVGLQSGSGNESFLRKYTRAAGTWGNTSSISPGINGFAAIAYHPHLFGPGVPGIFVWEWDHYYAYRIETDTWFNIGPTEGSGGTGGPTSRCENGTGDYVSGRGSVICSSATRTSAKDRLPVIEVLPGAGLSTDAAAEGTVIYRGEAPIRTDGPNFNISHGKLVAHPYDSGRVLIIEGDAFDDPQSRVWDSVDGGATWNLKPYTHPFFGMATGSTEAFTIGRINEHGVIIAMSSDGNGGETILWKPDD